MQSVELCLAQKFEMDPESLVIGLGPPASGTTWLYQLLYAHSQVATTRLKELNFFNDHFDYGLDWYRHQFHKPTPEIRLFADVSPTYLLSADVPARIRQFVRKPKLIVGLRNPYQRALSWYQRFRRHSYDVTAIASDAVLHEGFVKLGCIADTLHLSLEEFGEEKFFLLWHEDLDNDPVGTSARLQGWMDLSFENPVGVNKRVMASVRYRYPWTRPFLRGAGKIARYSAPALFYSAKYGPLHELVFRSLEMDEKVAAKVSLVFEELRDAYERDIDKLEVLLKRDLSGWRFEAQKRQLFSAAGEKL